MTLDGNAIGGLLLEVFGSEMTSAETTCAACGAVGLGAAGYVLVRHLRAAAPSAGAVDRSGRESWRMPPLAMLRRPAMSTGRKIGMSALRLYLAVAMILVVVRITELAIGH